METKINIAAILKDKPQGTKLYDWLYNIDIELDTISTTDTETVVWCTNETDNNTICHRAYSEFGTVRGCTDGLQILLPSKEMRDWRKFAWKRGNVLVDESGLCQVIFKEFEDDTYTTFEGTYWLKCDEDDSLEYKTKIGSLNTADFHIDTNENIRCYIQTISELTGRKLNLETLEVEKSQPEFKDGDIVAVDLERKNIRIFKEKENENNFCWGKYYIGFNFNNEGKPIQIFENYRANCISDRLATEEEKKQLFKALANEGKAWDADKKEVIALKPLWTPKAFDKVLVKDETYGSWKPALFWKRVDAQDLHPYMIIGGKRYRYCEPYEGNEKLLDD